MKKAPAYAPVLRYLVKESGMYRHPDRFGSVCGQSVWIDNGLHFMNHLDARAYADKIGGEVIKLRIRATEEPLSTRKKMPTATGCRRLTSNR